MTTMKEASKTGATGFGQLSNKELAVLQESSTALKRWLPPAEAQKILNVMKEKLKKILEEDTITSKGIPNYNPATQKLQQNQLDADTAKAILQEAGGDNDKAREIAKQRGYTF